MTTGLVIVPAHSLQDDLKAIFGFKFEVGDVIPGMGTYQGYREKWKDGSLVIHFVGVVDRPVAAYVGQPVQRRAFRKHLEACISASEAARFSLVPSHIQGKFPPETPVRISFMTWLLSFIRKSLHAI